MLSQRGLYLSRRRPTLPHTFACSTIGPAGLNFRVRYGNGWIPRGKITDNSRRSAGVNEPLISGNWEPAAEILSRVFGSRGEGSLYAISVSEQWIFNSLLQRTFKDREDNASQLNRLGVAYFLLGLLPISTTATKASLLSQTRRRPVSACFSLPIPGSGGLEKRCFPSAQVLAEG